jgi:hypothetical protein
MATTLKFFDPADVGTEILPAASGGLNTIGFYGPGFGLSVRVGDFNENTYRTTEDGQTNGNALPNLRWANTSGAFVANEILATPLLEVLNSEATLRVELITDVAVTTQNATFRAFDKSSIDNAPSGVDVFAAEIRNVVGPVGSGDQDWTVNLGGSGVVLSLDDQTNPNTTHNFWIGLSSTPTSIGEKTNFAFYFETEFL